MTPLAMTVYTLAVWLEASPPESMHLVFSKFCACGGLEFSALRPQNRAESGHKTLHECRWLYYFQVKDLLWPPDTISTIAATGF